jgi:hypothetical protein
MFNELQDIPFQVYAQDPEPERACRVCGCTENDPCLHPKHGPCWWEGKDLCSHCKHWPGEGRLYSQAITEGAYAD